MMGYNGVGSGPAGTLPEISGIPAEMPEEDQE
jgi:hypothetical protein